jgi:hypothetical protein
MVDAADDFSTRVVAAIHATRNAADQINELDAAEAFGEVLIEGSGNWKPAVKEALQRAGAAVDDTQLRSARVHLLFGDESEAGVAATEIITRLRNIELALRDWPHSITQQPGRAQYDRNFEGAVNGTPVQPCGAEATARHLATAPLAWPSPRLRVAVARASAKANCWEERNRDGV